MDRKIRNFMALTLGLMTFALCVLAQTITPNGQTPFAFIAWGDSRGTSTGSVDTAVATNLSNMARTLNPAFTIFAGDLCNGFDTNCTSSTSTGWKFAINGGSANNGLFDITFPFRGNHDDNAALWDSYFAGRDAVVAAIGGSNFSFYAPDGPERTYSFDFANSHIVGIDMPNGDISTMTGGQISWLDSDITAAESRGVTHTFILDHGPIYYVDGHSATPSAGFINVMNKHMSISATFHGHEHLMAHVHVDSAHIPGVTHPWEEFVTGGDGAPLTSCTASRLIGPTDFCEDNAFGFMSITVNGTTGVVNLFVQGQGSPIETWMFSQTAPPPPADTIAPTVTAFTIPGTSTSLTVPITTFTATDNVGVTGYMVTETSTAPSAGATGWTATSPTSHTFTTTGAKTLFAWAKDAAGNVSTSRSAGTTITLPDTTPPTVTAFTIPATSTSLVVPITTFTATDNVGVTGYLVAETSAAPSAGAIGWTTTPPTSHTFTTPGAKTLFAWAKDAAGNVSTSLSASTTITLPDTTPPTVTAFTIPATSSSLTVPITTFTATDNVGVTGYLVTETSAAPSAGATGWAATPPASHTFTTAGAKTLFAWAKDAAGNVSTSLSASTTISLPTGGPDTTPPTVTSFTLAISASGRTVQIASFTATDNVGVTGYMVTQTSKRPHEGSSKWRTTPPTSFTFNEHASGTITLFGWAKDAAGNISLPAEATTLVSASAEEGSAQGTSDSSDAAMDVWVSKWLAVSIQKNTPSEPDANGFLKIQSWNSDLSVLQATLFTQDSSTGKWQSVDLALQVDGTADRFLASFDYAGEFAFSSSVIATTDNGSLQNATLMAVGMSHIYHEDILNSKASGERLVIITGMLVPEANVPAEIRH